jgi:hypothetical protein
MDSTFGPTTLPQNFKSYSYWWARLLKQQTSITVYHFADQGKQTSDFCFLLVPFSTHIHIRKIELYINAHIHLHIYIYTAISNGKQKPWRFSLIHLPLLIVQTEVCHLTVCWWRNTQKLSICKRTKCSKWTKQTCPSMPTAKFVKFT